MGKRYEIKCDESILGELFASRLKYGRSMRRTRWIRLGMILFLCLLVGLLTCGPVGWLLALVLVWMELYYCFFLIACRKACREATDGGIRLMFGLDRMKITKRGILFWKEGQEDIRIFDSFSQFQGPVQLVGQFVFLWMKVMKKGGRQKIIPVVMPAQVPTEHAEEIAQKIREGIERCAGQGMVAPPSGMVYEGERRPFIVQRGIFPRVRFLGVLLYVAFVALTSVCVWEIEMLTGYGYSLLSRLLSYACAFFSPALLFYEWMIRSASDPVTWAYSVRNRAIVLDEKKSVVIIPFSRIQMLHVGKKLGVIETSQGVFLPFPLQMLSQIPNSLPRKTYRSGNFAYFLLCLVTLEAIGAIPLILLSVCFA